MELLTECTEPVPGTSCYNTEYQVCTGNIIPGTYSYAGCIFKGCLMHVFDISADPWSSRQGRGKNDPSWGVSDLFSRGVGGVGATTVGWAESVVLRGAGLNSSRRESGKRLGKDEVKRGTISEMVAACCVVRCWYTTTLAGNIRTCAL